jgi:hypothetical protein
MLYGAEIVVFLSHMYETQQHSVGRAYSCWMLNCCCFTWPVGFKRLKGLLRDVFISRSALKG